eukprot:2551767-Pleurochrysis_carterae.AAC.1
MMREARSCVEGEQKGARKATRTRKAGVNLFTALEPSLGVETQTLHLLFSFSYPSFLSAFLAPHSSILFFTCS